MLNLSFYFGAKEQAAENSNLFSALGIDLRLLVLQLLAFGILLWLLGKYVYPRLMSAIDERERAINESVAAAQAAEANAEKTQAKIDKLFDDARSEAASIVETAHKESAAMVAEAENKAKLRSEQIVSDARSQLEQDINKARKQLRNETAALVATATERIVREKVDSQRDKALIESALKEAL